MQEKQGAGYFIEIVVVVALLGCLSAVALPNVGHLVNKGKTESYNTELHNIQTAVVQMLVDSTSGTLEPVGPTDDMSRVQTCDTPPRILSDYLHFLNGTLTRSGCTYTFSADGTVKQFTPSQVSGGHCPEARLSDTGFSVFRMYHCLPAMPFAIGRRAFYTSGGGLNGRNEDTYRRGRPQSAGGS